MSIVQSLLESSLAKLNLFGGVSISVVTVLMIGRVFDTRSKILKVLKAQKLLY
jgi:hypothetical protein